MTSFIKQFVTYEKIGKLCNKLVEKIKDKHRPFDCIYAPPRGGLLPAIHLSHCLELPLILSLDNLTEKDQILVVDDICDTGKTFEDLKNKHKNLNIFWTSLFLKQRSIFIPNIYVTMTPNNHWIVFPYEKNDEIPNREV